MRKAIALSIMLLFVSLSIPHITLWNLGIDLNVGVKPAEAQANLYYYCPPTKTCKTYADQRSCNLQCTGAECVPYYSDSTCTKPSTGDFYYFCAAQNTCKQFSSFNACRADCGAECAIAYQDSKCGQASQNTNVTIPANASITNDRNCNIVRNIKVTASIAGTARYYAAGTPLTITGSAERFSDRCAGVKLTCQVTQENKCVIDTGHYKDTYKPIMCGTGVARSFPVKIGEYAEFSEWHWATIFRDIAAALSIIAMCGPCAIAIFQSANGVQIAVGLAAALNQAANAMNGCPTNPMMAAYLAQCVSGVPSPGGGGYNYYECGNAPGSCAQFASQNECVQQCGTCRGPYSDSTCGFSQNGYYICSADNSCIGPMQIGQCIDSCVGGSCQYAGPTPQDCGTSGFCANGLICQDSIACTNGPSSPTSCTINGRTGSCCNPDAAPNPTPPEIPPECLSCNGEDCPDYCRNYLSGNAVAETVAFTKMPSKPGVVYAQFGVGNCDPRTLLLLSQQQTGQCTPGQPDRTQVCSICGKNYKTTPSLDENARCTQGGEELSREYAEFKCSAATCGDHKNSNIHITVTGPTGTVIATDVTKTDAKGKFSYTMKAPAVDGKVTITLSKDPADITPEPPPGGGGGDGSSCDAPAGQDVKYEDDVGAALNDANAVAGDLENTEENAVRYKAELTKALRARGFYSSDDNLNCNYNPTKDKVILGKAGDQYPEEYDFIVGLGGGGPMRNAVSPNYVGPAGWGRCKCGYNGPTGNVVANPISDSGTAIIEIYTTAKSGMMP